MPGHAQTVEVTWGEGIVVQAHRQAGAGGLKAAVDQIIDTIGPHIGTRGTFAKFYAVDNPDSLNDRDRWRAWLLLVALGLDPASWGVPDTVVPQAFDVDRLKAMLPQWAPRGSNPQPTDYFNECSDLALAS